jgi:tetratricopeptide (TPR) repeat protein
VEDHRLVDLRETYEPYDGGDRYAALWRKHTAKPRASLVMDTIAWDVSEVRPTDVAVDPDDLDFEDGLTCQAAELSEIGDREGARELLMKALCIDLRCIDGHAHLGNLVFDQWPERAILHYEIGMRIGELSLPPEFDGVVLWGHISNRPFLRCLHGYGLCLWRRGQLAGAKSVFERILALNPNDNQGVRFCWHDVCRGRSWDEMNAREEAAGSEAR